MINGLVQNILDEIETNLRVAVMRTAMLPRCEAVKSFEHLLIDIIDERLPDLGDKIQKQET